MELRPFDRWCLGRKSIGVRALTHGERALLRAQSRSAWMRVANPALGFAAFWAVLVSLVPALLRGHVSAGVMPAIVALGMLLGLPVTLLLTGDILRRIGDARRDLETDRVERFAPLDLAAFTHEAPVLEVRQPSARVLRGPEHLIGSVIEVRAVAPAPIVGSRSALEAVKAPQGRRLEQRLLSLEECEEVRRSIHEMERVRPSRLVLVAWACLCLGAWILPPRPLAATDRFALGVSVLIGALAAVREVHGRRLARRMRFDVADGFAWVVTSQMPGVPREEEGLPRSRRRWSVAGTPAAWRGTALKGARRG